MNAAIGIDRLGGKASLTGPMGDAGESSSRYIFEDLAKEGIETGTSCICPDWSRRFPQIMMDPSGERTIVTFRDPELWKVPCPRLTICCEDCDAILTRAAARVPHRACVEARNRGIPVVVDVDRAVSQREGLLTASSHLVFSDEALQSTAGISDDVKALKKIANLTSSFLAVTRGPQGTIWLDENRACGGRRPSRCTPWIRWAPAISFTARSRWPSPRGRTCGTRCDSPRPPRR